MQLGIQFIQSKAKSIEHDSAVIIQFFKFFNNISEKYGLRYPSKEGTKTANVISWFSNKLYTEYINYSFCIGIVYIKKGYRGHGIFKKIFEIHLNIKKIKEKKINTYVHVFSNNISAIKTYKKNGFVVIKELKSNDLKIKKFLPYNMKQILIKKLTDD